MTSSKLEIYALPSDLVPDPVPCAVLLPPQYDATKSPLPLCLNLHGGGSSREALIQSQPMYEQLWQSGMLEPMVIATASTGELSFYLDEPGGSQWETFIAEAFLGHLRSKYNVRKDRNGTVMTGSANNNMKVRVNLGVNSKRHWLLDASTTQATIISRV